MDPNRPLPFAPSRRRLLLSLGSAVLLPAAPTARAAAASRPEAALPPDPNGKFDANGAVLPWPGDTVVSPLPFCSSAFRAMLDVNADVTRLFHACVAETPPSSYHMTIFGGADRERHARKWWPSDIPLDTPIEEVNRRLRERLSRATFDYQVPFRMVVDTSDDLPDAPAIFLQPATAVERQSLYRLRRQISDCLGIAPRDIETFRFHVTFGYIYRRMPQPVASAFGVKLRQWRRLVADTAVIEFPAPDYCVFADMFAFEPVLRLPRGRPSQSAAGANSPDRPPI